MVLTPVKCPHCGSDDATKNGRYRNGKQRFLRGNEKSADIIHLLSIIQTTHTIQISVRAYFFR
jgi:hypothetical protein